MPAGLRNLLEGEREEVLVVGFKFHPSVFGKNCIIAGKKFAGGKSALCMAVFWPGVGEI